MPPKFLRSSVLLGALLATSAATHPGLAGRWVQSSSGQELVLRPKIKLTPNAAIGYGISLGGSVGYGSATTTVVATEASPLKVEREMALTVKADGAFTWTITKRETESASCIRTVTQQRSGRATADGGELVLAVSAGRERYSNSCGGQGESAVPAVTERYAMRISGGEMLLSAGATRWRFRCA